MTTPELTASKKLVFSYNEEPNFTTENDSAFLRRIVIPDFVDVFLAIQGEEPLGHVNQVPSKE